VCVWVGECVRVCIRRFYCLYGDSMNVAARMSANAKESGVCVSPQIAAHLASAAASRRSVTAAVSLPRLSSFPSVCIGSECASPAAHRTSATLHTAIDVASEERERASMRAAETASDAGLGPLNSTLNSTLNTPHVTPLHPSLTETRVTNIGDSYSSGLVSEELADAASEACATPRLCILSRGVHLMLFHGIASHLTHVARSASDLL
jgi:hypothetical protein